MKIRRVSIQQKLQRIVLIISATSLIITSFLGMIIMLSIRGQSERALSKEIKSDLLNIVDNKSRLIESELSRYTEYSEAFADQLTAIYKEPERFIPWDPWKKRPEGFTRRYPVVVRSSEEIDIEAYAEEAALAENVCFLLYPVVDDGSKNISAVYWGNKNGLLTGFEYEKFDEEYDETIYDYFQVPWYKMCQEAGRSIFTDIYLDGFNRGLTITSASPYYDKEGNFYGVFGVDVLITSLYEESIKLDIGEGAYAFLVDRNGNVVSPDGEAKTVSENEGMEEEAVERLLRAESEVFLDHGIYYASSRVESTGWTICLHVPEELAMAPVRSIERGIRDMIIAFLVAFVLILLAVTQFIRSYSRSLTQPIMALREDVKQISGGNLEHKATVATEDEVGDLARSFNDMSASLQLYIEDVKHMTAEKERISAELDLASKIQADLLPTKFPAFPDRKEFDIYAATAPAKEMGGDFFDFFLTDEDHLAIVIADVSGKGMPAAMFMAIARTVIKNFAMTGIRPSEVLAKTNDHLSENNAQNLFVTAWFALLTLSTGEVVCADAGHEFPLIKGEDGYALLKGEHDPPLATLEGNEYQDRTFRLEKGGEILVYTDGVTDAKNAQKERFGLDRFLETVRAAAEESPEDRVHRLKDAVDAFTGTNEPFDDITLLCVRYEGV